ncbi:MAG: trypsin-like peptidase domain-containing protein [Clostridiales bacterium]|nr:trypsin-like peptidase domain-containing protein [Clostridiales bacterium]
MFLKRAAAKHISAALLAAAIAAAPVAAPAHAPWLGAASAHAGAGAATAPGALLAASNGLAEIVSRAEPSVVGIIGKIGPTSKEYSEAAENIVVASGIVYKSNGFIVTNNHVTEECEKIFVVLSDKRVYEATLVAADESSDLALLKISKGMLKPVVFADSAAVRTGESVITIGTPVEFGLQNTVGFGIVSGINRGNTGFTEYQFLQTDAAANPGNSGGPLMNMDGGVLGIIAGGYSMFQGLTFCITSETIQYVIPQLEANGKVRRPDLGARLVQGLVADFGLPTDGGLFFTEIEDGGVADAAGITAEDTLISLNGVKLSTATAYVEELKKYAPGDTAELVLERGGAVRSVSVTFGERR